MQSSFQEKPKSPIRLNQFSTIQASRKQLTLPELAKSRNISSTIAQPAIDTVALMNKGSVTARNGKLQTSLMNPKQSAIVDAVSLREQLRMNEQGLLAKHLNQDIKQEFLRNQRKTGRMTVFNPPHIS